MANNPAMNLNHWLKRERGRQSGLAKHLGIKPPQVADWISQDKPVPVVHMAEIEAYTDGAVTRRDMRPTDWQRIWPELAQVNAASRHLAPAASGNHAATAAQEA